MRYAFCSKISSVCAFVGPAVTVERVLPCIENAIVDVDERVVARAVRCLCSLVQLGLLTARSILADVVKSMVPLVLHPSQSVREAALRLCAAAFAFVGEAEASVFLLPALKPVQQVDVLGCALTYEVIALSVVAPISRSSYRAAIRERLKGISLSSEAELDLIGPPTIRQASSHIRAVKLRLFDAADLAHDVAELAAAKPTLPVVSAEDAPKIELMTKYIERVASEINSKYNNVARGGGATTAGSGGGKAGEPGQRRLLVGEIDTRQNISASGDDAAVADSAAEVALEYATASVSECAVESMLVPHQKGGAQFCPTFASESLRATVLTLPSVTRDSDKVQLVHGIYSVDAAKKALAGGVFYPKAINMGIVEAGAAKGKGAVAARQDGGAAVGAARDQTVEATVLLRRVEALNVPLLPPDVGQLAFSEDRRVYVLSPLFGDCALTSCFFVF